MYITLITSTSECHFIVFIFMHIIFRIDCFFLSLSYAKFCVALSFLNYIRVSKYFYFGFLIYCYTYLCELNPAIFRS